MNPGFVVVIATDDKSVESFNPVEESRGGGVTVQVIEVFAGDNAGSVHFGYGKHCN